MNILLLITPDIPVPPVLYGGIERIVFLLANEYTLMGHNVTLLAGPGSYCAGETICFGVSEQDRSKSTIRQEIRFVWKYLYQHRNNFDLIHNFGRLVYLLPVLNHRVKKIMSYQREVTQKNIRILNMLPQKNMLFTACSDNCVSTGNVAGNWTTVYNALDYAAYTLNPLVEDNTPLMFLGRLDKIKGAHTAIRVAKATNNNLVLAGNIPTTADNLHYYKTEIEPLIDGVQIKYVGPVDDVQKNDHLQKAKALLFPIEWEEPFGIVMIEAMACGTPVIGFNRGSVPEVVDEGITGYIVNDESDMIRKVGDINKIDRTQCRQRAETRFSIKVIAEQYLSL